MSDLQDSGLNSQNKKSKNKTKPAHDELRSWHGIKGFNSFDDYIDEDDSISYGDGHSGWNR